MYENRTYAVIDNNTFQYAVEHGNVSVSTLFQKVIETSVNTLRYSFGDEEFIVKCDSEEDIQYLRDRAAEEGILYTEYNYANMLTELQKPEWNGEEPIAWSSSSSSGE